MSMSRHIIIIINIDCNNYIKISPQCHTPSGRYSCDCNFSSAPVVEIWYPVKIYPQRVLAHSLIQVILVILCLLSTWICKWIACPSTSWLLYFKCHWNWMDSSPTLERETGKFHPLSVKGWRTCGKAVRVPNLQPGFRSPPENGNFRPGHFIRANTLYQPVIF